MKKILVISGSPKKDGNTAVLADWLAEGASAQGAEVEVIYTPNLKINGTGCLSCRSCQKSDKYECLIADDVRTVLKKMSEVDVIVMASPLYFFSASAQIKIIFDRMFSLYKWDNASATMKTVLKGKTFAVVASAYEDIGFDAFEKPFAITAEYTGMKFASLLVPNAGVSGEIKNKPGIREQAIAFGQSLA